LVENNLTLVRRRNRLRPNSCGSRRSHAMDKKIILGFLILSLIFAGCSSQAANEVKSGRTALLYGKPKDALTHFQQAAETDPKYVNDFTQLKQGVWTYVGRAYYDLHNFPEAQTILTQALERNDNDFMARLYLGLTEIQLQRTPRPVQPLSLADVLT